MLSLHPVASETKIRRTKIYLTFKQVLLLMVAAAAASAIVLLFFLSKGEEYSIKIPLLERGYLVSSSRCQIPNIDPFDPSIMTFVYREEPIVCSLRPPLTYTARHEGRVQLRIAANVTSQYVELTQAHNLQCCYSPIVRMDDFTNKKSACVEFESSVTLERSVQHVYVSCVDHVTKRHVYNNVHAVVQARDGLTMTPPGQRPRMKIVLLGIDSMSRLSLMRNMPKTVEILHSNGWIELLGYNKIAENTRPNLFAILTGLSESQVRNRSCLEPRLKSLGYDHCPFLWRDFKRRGYVTAYAEDEPRWSTFNEDSFGFNEPPTDFYLRPLMVKALEKMPIGLKGGFAICIGNTRTTDVVLGYSLDLLEAFHNGVFGIFWLNSFSHDDENMPSAMDETMERYFSALQSSGALDRTMFVFLSDHGIRFGRIRRTKIGWFEERLPFAFVSVPQQFREEHMEAFANLQANGKRLTSPFDMHLTLRDVVDDSIGKPGNGSAGCRTCGSLFSPVKQDRSCAEAGIPDHWCTCLPRQEISTSLQPVKLAVSAAVAHVNALLSVDVKVNQTGHCALFRVDKIMRAQLVDMAAMATADFNDYSVVFTVAPGSSVLDATVRHWSHEKSQRFEVLQKVSRISAMFNESCKWVTDKTVELYCFCL